ncbi:S-layer homology domain-containing protein [Bacillus wiedmannii]|uniref:S-layer homology domain-containing protein n=1 Tax=Bacillus wiedmannii TaxID=1890302 RepID=UPI0021CF8AFA|nr:S-layer homology domain-containing protein [Bacillus wiedmannii]MCU5578441.1 S-layer homology domain-containing protein [Bacillus wiedmannii]
MKYKLIATGILAGSLLSYSTSAFANTHKFPDVPAWADKSVNYLVDKKVLSGYPDGTFGSSDSLDRAAAATIMTKALGIQVDFDAKPSFTDSQNHWATPYIAAAEKAGIIKGEGNGIFNPSGKVTRAAMAAMLVNAYKLQDRTNSNGQITFDDIKGHWGEKHANILIQTEISKGTEDGNSWSPNRPITRAEAAQFLAKADQIHHQTKQVENTVVGVINDADPYYVTVTYKDANGNSQEVTIDFPNGSNSNFKNGDKVKVANKNQWKHQKIYGQTVFYTDVNSISKVNEESKKQQENHVMSKDKEQKLLAQLKKRSGTVTKKSEDSLEISSDNQTIRAHVNPKVLPNIQIGDTVNVYAQAFEMDVILLKDLPFEAKNAIIQKGNEKSILENQYEKITGNVVQKSENSILVSSNNINYEVETSTEVLQDIVIGDTVNVYAASFEFSPILLADVPVKAISPIVEKTN